MPDLFPNASNFNVGNVVQNDHFFQGSEGRGGSALRELYAHVAAVALHTADARIDAPKCHEETRKAVQQHLSTWASREIATPTLSTPQQPRELLWLTGPAGTGKTAIMGTVSEILDKMGRLAATFYFSTAMGVLGTTSKRLFVTTLAYQMAVHQRLKGRLASSILSAVRENPGVFDMSLTRQLEVLILEPLRTTQDHQGPSSQMPTCILVDGVDECLGSGEGLSRRSRQDNQIEVLSVLLQAVSDPAFPFHIIVASRPETWIRRHFTKVGAGRIHEVFLDDKYKPDDDIRSYLRSKFAEKCLQSGINPSAWPPEDAIPKLVENASGQFIYAATVFRFIDAPGSSPQAQLDAVLNLKVQPEAMSHPFAMLDALYSSILKSTPTPDTTVLWLRGIHLIQEGVKGYLTPSAWTLDRLFESYEGQALSVLSNLPSLLYMVDGDTDLTRWKQNSALELSGVECGASYAFYHKSFLDYLHDDVRCGVAFPDLIETKVKTWLGRRVSQTLKSCGPEAPVPPVHVPLFQNCFLDLVVWLTSQGLTMVPDAKIIADCEPSVWFSIVKKSPRVTSNDAILRVLYIFVHSNCRPFLPCNPGCKRWRRAFAELPHSQWRRPWRSIDVLLDQLCIKRIAVPYAWQRA